MDSTASECPVLSDRELGEQLFAFMRAIPQLWTRDDLQKMHASGLEHVEYRGPEERLVVFSMSVLQHHVSSDEDWIQVYAHVADPTRGRSVGGSYLPLSGAVIVHAKGQVEFTKLGNGGVAPESFQPIALSAIAVSE